MKPSASAVAATADFVAEHLADTAQDRRLIGSFSATRNAKGLEVYLKTCALRSASFVAAKWLCIYALPEPKLLDYYRKNLGFSRLPPEKEAFVYGHVKPKYDQDCIFMYQPL